MRVIVLGGGVVGITTAYFLAGDGHDVAVLEREASVGQDATAGNAGLIAPGHSYAWASPAARGLLARSLFGAETAIRLNPAALSPELVRWGLRFLRECTAARARVNTLAKYRLCAYSESVLRDIASSERIDYAASGGGMFYLYGSEEELRAGYERAAILREQGRELVLLDPDECAQREPALEAARASISGAVFGAQDSSGDCERFTAGLAQACERRGVEIHTGTTVRRLRARGQRIASVETDGGELQADAYVMALGVMSPSIARTVGQRLPVYPAKGYSATFPIRDGDACPTAGGVDENTLVAWSRLGDRLRMSSTAEFTGFDRSWKPGHFAGILATARRLFPAAADYDRGSYRACLRPMTPDGPPVIGAGRHANLHYNTGHGHMGWTMAAGSARILADLIAGRPPEISTEGMEVR